MLWEIGAAAFVGYAGLPTLWMRWRSQRTLRQGPTDLPEVALTFDDGPDPVGTPQVLSILSQANVRATFFLLGAKAARYPDLVRQIVAAGHEIGSHMYHHRITWFLGPKATRRELVQSIAAITDAAGRPPTCFRPPWGVFNTAMLLWGKARQALLPPVIWTLHAGDWYPRVRPEQITRRILRRVAPGSIVLLHDGCGYPGNPSALISALPEAIRQLKARGYHFVTLNHWPGGTLPEEVNAV